jgi:hypothetical protein
VIGLVAISRDGVADSVSDDLPELGKLRDQLLACRHPLADEVQASCDPALRNSESHVEWQYDAAARAVIGRGRNPLELTLDELHEEVELICGCISALDAALACFVAVADLSLGTPSWIAEGRAPELRSRAVQLVLDALDQGELRAELTQDVLEVSAGDGAAEEFGAGWAVLSMLLWNYYLDARRGVLRRSDGSVDRMLDAAAAHRYESSEGAKDLAQFYVHYSSGCLAGRRTESVFEDCLVLLVRMVEPADPAQLFAELERDDLSTHREVAQRIRWVVGFGNEHSEVVAAEARQCLDELAAAAATVDELPSRGHQALAEFFGALANVMAFKERLADEQGGLDAIYERLVNPPVVQRENVPPLAG